MPRYPNYRVRRRAPVSPVGTADTLTTTISGRVDLIDMEVMAIVDELPNDDLDKLVRMH